MSDPTQRVAASQAELDIANSGPALLSNRFYISVGPFGVRIAFTEQLNPDKPPAFRTAVVMSIQDGINLSKVMQDLLRDAEANIEKITAAAQSTKINV